MLPSLSQLSVGGAYDDEDTRSDTSSSSSSSSGSDSEPDEQPVKNALYRSYLKFTVSQDSENQSFLSRTEFAQLDLYQIEALRDNDDPLGLSKEMQGASRHFPCHVFWCKELASGKYAVWGRPTVGLHEQEAVIRMLQAQREERRVARELRAAEAALNDAPAIEELTMDEGATPPAEEANLEDLD